MNVYCTMTAKYTKADIKVPSKTGNIAIVDINIDTAIDNDNWNMRKLADFQGEGFRLDGSCELVNKTMAGSLKSGKFGIRSAIGGTITLKVTSTQTIPAVTMAFTAGEGTVSTGNDEYEIRRIVIVPVNGKSVTLTIASSDPEKRVELASILPGLIMQFDRKNITVCTTSLKSDLSMQEPSWPISDIELKAYWPDDISEAISNIGDDVPITYKAGYPGDYSETRNFYLSEAAEQSEGIITIRGEDASHKLEDAREIPMQRLDCGNNSGYKTLYNWFVDIIKATGIRPVSVEKSPGATKSKTYRSMIMTQRSPRDHVQNVMNLMRMDSFWPTFVDAGIPQISWSKPVKKWDIYEEECGDVVRKPDRNIAKITAEDENGIHSYTTRKTKWVALAKDIKVKKGVPVKKSFSDYYWAYSVKWKKKNKFTKAQLNGVEWIPTVTSKKVKKKTKKKYKSGKKKGQYKYKKVWINRPTLYGKRLIITKVGSSIIEATKRPGTTAHIEPMVYGRCYQGTTFIFPNYSLLFKRNNIAGSFTHKGNPQWQPRDVFTFHRLDGRTETCTFENITFIHEGGGMLAQVTYRKGIC